MLSLGPLVAVLYEGIQSLLFLVGSFLEQRFNHLLCMFHILSSVKVLDSTVASIGLVSQSADI
ncbi:mCG148490 [Mus musculus]|nr:mCG148490 [Mus musculus]